MAREYINREDMLNTGREKLNRSIDKSYDAEETSVQALKDANVLGNKAIADANKLGNESIAIAKENEKVAGEANLIAKDTNERMNQIISGETDSAEIIDARKPVYTNPYETVGERLNAEIGNLDNYRKGINLSEKIKKDNEERGLSITSFLVTSSETPKEQNQLIQNAVNYCSENNITLFFPNGHFWIKAHLDTTPAYPLYLENNGGIFLPSNINIVCSPETYFHSLDHTQRASNLFRTYNSFDVSFTDGKFISGKSGEQEFNYAFAIQGGGRVTVNRFRAKGFTGDGINIQRSNMSNNPNYIPVDIVINDVICDENGRQGISVEEVDGIKITNSIFSNTNKNAPKSGLDIEPAYQQTHDKAICKAILIENCDFFGNVGNGLQLVGSYIVEDVTIRRCRFYDNNKSNSVSSVKIGSCKKIVIEDCDFEDNEILIIQGVTNITVDNCRIKNGQICIQYKNTDVHLRKCKFDYTFNVKDRHSVLIEEGDGAISDLLIEDCIFNNMVDLNTLATDYGQISALYIKGARDITSKGNTYIGYSIPIRNDFYNSSTITKRLTSIDDTFLTAKQQAILSVADDFRVINPKFIGCGRLNSINNNFSRDVQWSTQLTSKRMVLDNATGDKKPLHPDANYKEVGSISEEVMLHVTTINKDVSIGGMNNRSKYSVANPYTLGNFVNSSLSSLSSELITIHKDVVDYSEFVTGSLVLILETNKIGYIDQSKKFVELNKK